MIKKRGHSKNTIIKTFVEYGLHIWVILFVANILLLYASRFYIHGSVCMNRQQVLADNRCLYVWGNRVFQKEIISSMSQKPSCGSDLTGKLPAAYVANQTRYIIPHFIANLCEVSVASSVLPTKTLLSDVSVIPSPSDTPLPSDTPEPTPTPTPAGPVIGLIFSVPGIGSGGGNLKPLHPTRNVTIYLYPPQLNAFDKTVKPLYTIHTQAIFDSDPNSPTYTSFLNQTIDLGGQIPDGSYQIVFKTDQTLRQLIKAKPDDVGGQVFSLGRNLPVYTSPQTLIPGDIFPYPDGDNVMDINDYNALVNCFDSKTVQRKCPSRQAADLDDDGVVDGVDYNLMMLSFKTLLALGFPAPSITAVPTPAPTKILPTHSPVPTKSVKVTPLPKTAQPKKATKSGGIGGVLFFFFVLAALAGGGFFAVKKGLFSRLLHPMPAEPPPPQQGEGQQAEPAAEPEPEAVSQEPAAQSSDVIEKECYLKKKSTDDSGTWLTLTDDNGQVEGLFKGAEVLEGFVKVKGIMKKENDKSYLLISEIRPVE